MPYRHEINGIKPIKALPGYECLNGIPRPRSERPGDFTLQNRTTTNKFSVCSRAIHCTSITELFIETSSKEKA